MFLNSSIALFFPFVYIQENKKLSVISDIQWQSSSFITSSRDEASVMKKRTTFRVMQLIALINMPAFKGSSNIEASVLSFITIREPVEH